MTKFEQTNSYQKMLKESGTINVGFLYQEGVVITPENLELILEQKLNYYKENLELIKKNIILSEEEIKKKFFTPEQMENYYRNELKNRMGKKPIKTCFITLQLPNIDLKQIEEIENDPDFEKWLID